MFAFTGIIPVSIRFINNPFTLEFETFCFTDNRFIELFKLVCTQAFADSTNTEAFKDSPGRKPFRPQKYCMLIYSTIISTISLSLNFSLCLIIRAQKTKYLISKMLYLPCNKPSTLLTTTLKE